MFQFTLQENIQKVLKEKRGFELSGSANIIFAKELLPVPPVIIDKI